MSAYLVEIGPADNPVHQPPAVRTDSDQGAGGQCLEMEIYHPAIGFLRTPARRAEYLIRPQPAFPTGSTLLKKNLEHPAFDQPWPLRHVRRQAFVLDPSDHRLPVDTDRIGGLPDGVNLMAFDTLG